MQIRRQAVEIRRAVAADAGAMAAILAQAFEPFRPLYTAGGYAATTPPAEILADRLDEGPAWLALIDGRPVGTVAARHTPAGVYVRSMAVLTTERGAGVGRGLLDAVEAEARALGAKRLYLSTTPFLDAAIRLYERAGFVRTDEGPSDLHGTPLVTMAKVL